MTSPRKCANCGALLPSDHPAGHNYCEKCSAAWQRVNAPAVPGKCANCGAPFPSDQAAGHSYCEKCSAAWQRGNAPR
jgi:DNA-directed RNA polymerase subunit RPC12/RpoP